MDLIFVAGKTLGFLSLNLECNLRDWVLPDGTWNLDLVRLWLPEDIVIRIVSIPLPHPNGGIDRIIWARSRSFSVRSTYWTLKESSWGPLDDSWNLVWKYQDPQRLQDKGITWSCLFGIVAGRLWKNKNLFIFQDINWSASETIKSSLSWDLHFEPFFIEAKSTVHLFTDGAVARDSGNAAAGGVIRDRSGN
ncbi:hypothetical protein PVK06_013454 [Gossypium arboreum]|uniref:Uncharacterized protein n=1 Tax=Gossypium arboreum TaxID=29729 RepID=A0ABR0PRP9_GOSAR|nr:hypothetical protein PVK06_013454 [Gossypium arboreum]